MTLYDALGITPIINAAGTHTRLSGSLIHPQVMDAMAAASRVFVDMEELHLAAGRHLAELLGVEAAHVSGCCSAGIARSSPAAVWSPLKQATWLTIWLRNSSPTSLISLLPHEWKMSLTRSHMETRPGLR